MSDYVIASGYLDVTPEYLFNQRHNLPNNPFDFLNKLKEYPNKPDQRVLNQAVTPVKFIKSHQDVNGDLVAQLTDEQVQTLRETYRSYVRQLEALQKLYPKLQAANRRAGKLLQRLLKSRNVTPQPNQSLGISREDGTLYLGDRVRVYADPEAPPNVLAGDQIIGKLTKQEDRQITELSLYITDLQGQIKLGETNHQANRIALLELYYQLFGEQFMHEVLTGPVSADKHLFVVNEFNNTVRFVAGQS